MAYGTIGGLTQNWSDADIKDARSAGLFFTGSTPTATTTTPKLGTPVTRSSTPTVNATTTTSKAIPANVIAVRDQQIANQKAATAAKVVAPAVADPMVQYKKMLDEAKQKRIDATVSGLQNRYSQTVSDINTKKAALNPAYQTKRTQAQVGSQLQAKNFAEFLANRGLARGGTSQQAELTRNMQLQNTMNQYDQQQKDDTTYYNTLQDNATRALNNDITTVQSDAEANALDSFLNYKTQQDTLRQQQDFTREQNALSNELKKKELLQFEYDSDRQKRLDAEKDYTSSILGLGDYQAEINNIQNDGDPTNDWKLKLLTAQRQLKMDNTLKREIETISRYGNDYQAEINRRMQTPDNTDDKLIPYLEMARGEKLSGMAAAQAKQEELDRKYELDRMKTEYDINKPYYKAESSGTATQDKALKEETTRATNIAGNYVKSYVEQLGANAKYWNTVGSAERRTAFDNIMTLLRNSGLSGEAINDAVVSTGLTEFIQR